MRLKILKKRNELMADFPKYLDLLPVKHVSGQSVWPGSKSISNRTLLLSALADGKTLIKDLLFSDDTQVMLEALKSLGIQWNETGVANEYEVNGANGPFGHDRKPICFWEMLERLSGH